MNPVAACARAPCTIGSLPSCASIPHYAPPPRRFPLPTFFGPSLLAVKAVLGDLRRPAFLFGLAFSPVTCSRSAPVLTTYFRSRFDPPPQCRRSERIKHTTPSLFPLFRDAAGAPPIFPPRKPGLGAPRTPARLEHSRPCAKRNLHAVISASLPSRRDVGARIPLSSLQETIATGYFSESSMVRAA